MKKYISKDKKYFIVVLFTFHKIHSFFSKGCSHDPLADDPNHFSGRPDLSELGRMCKLYRSHPDLQRPRRRLRPYHR